MGRFRLYTFVSGAGSMTGCRPGGGGRDVADVRHFQRATHQQSLVLEQHAEIPGGVAVGLGFVDDDGVEEALAADGGDDGVVEGVEAVTEAFAELGGALHHVLLADELEGADGDGRPERIAAEGGPVRARFDGEHEVFGAEHAAHGIHAAGEGFAQCDEIGFDAAVLVTEEFAGACDACLDLVADQQDVVFFAERLHRAQVRIGGDHDAGFALDRLDDDGGGFRAVGLEGGADVGDAVEVEGFTCGRADAAQVGEVRAVVVATFRVRGHSYGGELVERR